MKKVILGLVMAVVATSALAKPPLPDNIPTHGNTPTKKVCDVMAKIATDSHQAKGEGRSYEEVARQLTVPASMRGYQKYLIEKSGEVGYHSRSEQSASDEIWGHCYRYLFFQE